MQNVSEPTSKATVSLIVFAKVPGQKDVLVGKWVKRDREISFHKFLVWLTRKFPDWAYINVYDQETRRYLRRIYR